MAEQKATLTARNEELRRTLAEHSPRKESACSEPQTAREKERFAEIVDEKNTSLEVEVHKGFDIVQASNDLELARNVEKPR